MAHAPEEPDQARLAGLRYRLWDPDRLVSRTVTYAAVAALLLVLPATRLAGNSGSLAVAAATLAAAAFQPPRRRVQDLADRRFNRRRYDAARTLEAFATRLRDQVDLGALDAELLGVVDTPPCSRPTLGCGCAPRPSAHGRRGRNRRRRLAMETTEVDGLRIAYERAGHGPPLVLLHGYVGDARPPGGRLRALR